jgi:sugar phosphate isomerase/epimerase
LNDVSAKNVHVNFDPANMILYGAGDPIEAVKILGRHIRHVHVKDAVLSRQPGVLWGEEVPFGSGQVGPARFLEAMKGVGYGGPLAVEREAGSARLADVGTAIESLRNAVG